MTFYEPPPPCLFTWFLNGLITALLRYEILTLRTLFMWCLLDDHAAFSDVAVIHESKKKKKEKKLKQKK